MFFFVANIILFSVVFKEAPPTPPSMAQIHANEEESINFLASVKSLLLNRSYVLLLIAYGINVGIFYAISTLLNQIVLQYYPVSVTSDRIFGTNSLIFCFCMFSFIGSTRRRWSYRFNNSVGRNGWLCCMRLCFG